MRAVLKLKSNGYFPIHVTTENDICCAVFNANGWSFRGGVRLVWNFCYFLASLTPAIPNLVEPLGKKRGELVFAITLARENHSGRFFGRFWVSSTFWSHWSRFQSHWRSFSGDFASGKLSGPLGPFQCLSCLEAMCIHSW